MQDKYSPENIKKRMDLLTTTALFNQIKVFKILDDKKDEEDIKNKLIKIVNSKYTVDVYLLINNTNAIIYDPKSIGDQYPFTYICDNKKGEYFASFEEAMLGWIGRKYEGRNSRFADYAYRMLNKECNN